VKRNRFFRKAGFLASPAGSSLELIVSQMDVPPLPLNRAFLSLGSNIEAEANLPAAARLIAELGSVVSVSRVWQSAPVGDTRQADFCNAAVLLETPLTVEELIGETGLLRQIESRLGRVRNPSNKNAPRTIDIDLSLFNHETLRIRDKQIPDQDISARAFVAAPLAELNGDYRVPGDGRTLREIAAALVAERPLTERPDIVLLTQLAESPAVATDGLAREPMPASADSRRQ
jgi:2-amino-4-hydroxy-6-hydroxymethyldihydropteridine diphosphokinase